MTKLHAVAAIFFGFTASVQAVEMSEIPYDSSMVTWLTTSQKEKATINFESEKKINKKSDSKKGSLYSTDAQQQVAAATNIVTTNSYLNLYQVYSAPSRQQWYGFLAKDLGMPMGWNYEGYTYSLVLNGGYGGGVADTSRVELIMCVNWANSLQHCKILRDDSDDYAVQHDAVSFSGFPVVTPNSQITYFLRVLEHIGPYQPYQYPTPVTVTISSKLYLSN